VQPPLLSPPGVRVQHCHKYCLQEKKQHTVSEKQRKSEWTLLLPRQEGDMVCWLSSTPCLCFTYQTLLTAPAVTATPVPPVALRADDPRQLSSLQLDSFTDQPALCAEGSRGHIKIQYCSRNQRAAACLSSTRQRHSSCLASPSRDQLCNFNIRHCNKNLNFLNKKRICIDHPFWFPWKSYQLQLSNKGLHLQN